MYEELQVEGYLVDYERVPVTDEKSPKEQDFDILVSFLNLRLILGFVTVYVFMRTGSYPVSACWLISFLLFGERMRILSSLIVLSLMGWHACIHQITEKLIFAPGQLPPKYLVCLSSLIITFLLSLNDGGSAHGVAYILCKNLTTLDLKSLTEYIHSSEIFRNNILRFLFVFRLIKFLKLT